MADFSHLKKSAVDPELTRDYPLFDLDMEPVPYVTVRSATEANSAYANGALRAATKDVRRSGVQRVDAEFLARDREIDRELYAEHVITGWKGVKDSKGAEVAFSAEEARGFLAAIPDHTFDALRVFCREPRNFTAAATEPLTGADADATAKN